MIEDKECLKEILEKLKELKGRNANQRSFLPGWKNLSKNELINKLQETLDCFDEDLNEIIKFIELKKELK